jgi:hypothetical protein
MPFTIRAAITAAVVTGGSLGAAPLIHAHAPTAPTPSPPSAATLGQSATANADTGVVHASSVGRGASTAAMSAATDATDAPAQGSTTGSASTASDAPADGTSASPAPPGPAWSLSGAISGQVDASGLSGLLSTASNDAKSTATLAVTTSSNVAKATVNTAQGSVNTAQGSVNTSQAASTPAPAMTVSAGAQAQTGGDSSGSWMTGTSSLQASLGH